MADESLLGAGTVDFFDEGAHVFAGRDYGNGRMMFQSSPDPKAERYIGVGAQLYIA
jgi:hypothetical protein